MLMTMTTTMLMTMRTTTTMTMMLKCTWALKGLLGIWAHEASKNLTGVKTP